jgi:hypothetical protein
MTFTVLGLPDWPGRRGEFFTGGTGRLITSCLHTYGPDAPAVVIGQDSGGTPLREVLLNLPAAVGATGLDRRTELHPVTGEPAEVLLSTWSVPDLASAEFAWRGHRIAVASWRLPLDAGFFGSLGPVATLPAVPKVL